MSVEFHAEPDPSRALLEEVAALAPENPFLTHSYAEARSSLGEQPWVLSLRDEGRAISACAGFQKTGRVSRTLEIPSFPSLKELPTFWDGLLALCRRLGVTHLYVNSYASIEARIPATPNALRTSRTEYVMTLSIDDLWKPLRKGHRWCVNRARKAGLTVTRSRDESACHEHAAMKSASMDRRRDRGEAVSADSEAAAFMSFLQCGAGEIFQATRDGEVVSSALVLRSHRGAYLHTAGTSPEGMDCGASHFLVFEVAGILRDEGALSFNLGGVNEANEGLRLFKVGFGAARRELESAELFVGTRLQKKLGDAARSLRETLASLSKS